MAAGGLEERLMLMVPCTYLVEGMNVSVHFLLATYRTCVCPSPPSIYSSPSSHPAPLTEHRGSSERLACSHWHLWETVRAADPCHPRGARGAALLCSASPPPLPPPSQPATSTSTSTSTSPPPLPRRPHSAPPPPALPATCAERGRERECAILLPVARRVPPIESRRFVHARHTDKDMTRPCS